MTSQSRKLVNFITLCAAAPILMFLGGLGALTHPNLSGVSFVIGLLCSLVILVLTVWNLWRKRHRAIVGFVSCACCFYLLIQIPGWIRGREYLQKQELKKEK